MASGLKAGMGFGNLVDFVNLVGFVNFGYFGWTRVWWQTWGLGICGVLIFLVIR